MNVYVLGMDSKFLNDLKKMYAPVVFYFNIGLTFLIKFILFFIMILYSSCVPIYFCALHIEYCIVCNMLHFMA